LLSILRLFAAIAWSHSRFGETNLTVEVKLEMEEEQEVSDWTLDTLDLAR
jgi:hypothetical protein